MSFREEAAGFFVMNRFRGAFYGKGSQDDWRTYQRRRCAWHDAAVRAVVRTALGHGMRVIGIQRGFNGLLNGETYEMNLRSVSEIIHRGGTVLYTARCLEFKTEEGPAQGR